MDTVFKNVHNECCLSLPFYYDVDHIIRYAFTHRNSFEVKRFTSLTFAGEYFNLLPILNDLNHNLSYEQCCEILTDKIEYKRWGLDTVTSSTRLRMRT